MSRQSQPFKKGTNDLAKFCEAIHGDQDPLQKARSDYETACVRSQMLGDAAKVRTAMDKARQEYYRAAFRSKLPAHIPVPVHQHPWIPCGTPGSTGYQQPLYYQLPLNVHLVAEEIAADQAVFYKYTPRWLDPPCDTVAEANGGGYYAMTPSSRTMAGKYAAAIVDTKAPTEQWLHMELGSDHDPLWHPYGGINFGYRTVCSTTPRASSTGLYDIAINSLLNMNIQACLNIPHTVVEDDHDFPYEAKGSGCVQLQASLGVRVGGSSQPWLVQKQIDGNLWWEVRDGRPDNMCSTLPYAMAHRSIRVSLPAGTQSSLEIVEMVELYCNRVNTISHQYPYTAVRNAMMGAEAMVSGHFQWAPVQLVYSWMD